MVGEHLLAGWPGIRTSNHALVLQGRELLTAALDSEAPVPAEMIGSIASLSIPADRYPGHNAFEVVESLHDTWSIEVPVSPWPTLDHRLLRISAQQYNTLTDYELLARALTSKWPRLPRCREAAIVGRIGL